jgi:hypothetical protein
MAMITATPDDDDARVNAAYAWAAGLIGLARRLVANDLDVDLTPIRPAIRDLCDGIRLLPKREAAIWLNRLIELQHEMAALTRELARRDGVDSADG